MTPLTRALVGRESPPLVVEVEKGHIRRFAEAIGDADPVYRDEQAARAAGHERVPAPPTFAIALRPNDVRDASPGQPAIEIDWRKLLHAEQELDLRRPILAGDRFTLVQSVADVFEKTGKAGPMDFLVLETRATDDAGDVAFLARTTIVVRRS